MMALLDIRDLVVRYGAITAVRGVSLTVAEGEIVALVGSNGAGKTSILRAISGLVRPAAGEIRFAGESIVGTAAHLLPRRGLVHAPEGRGIFTNLTVAENLDLGARLRADRVARAADMVRVWELFPILAQRRAQPASTLSGGEQQMLAIARALLAGPRLMLLDEPSLGLAPKVTQSIFAVLGQIRRQGTAILLVEQNAAMALRLADRAYVVESGTVVAAGTGAQLLHSPEIRRAYLGE